MENRVLRTSRWQLGVLMCGALLVMITSSARAVGDDIAERVIESVQSIAQTGKIGDGKIFVFELSEAIRVRTGETGEEAL